MKDNFDELNKALNTASDIVKSEPKEMKIVKSLKSEDKDIQKDYEYTRGNLYSLIEKGQEAINGIMEVAEEGASARAYEVAGQLIKSVADTTDKLLDLQKKMKDIDEVNIKQNTTNVTNNSLFVGSTSELQKMLKKANKENDK